MNKMHSPLMNLRIFIMTLLNIVLVAPLLAVSQHCGSHYLSSANKVYYLADHHYAYQLSFHQIRCHPTDIELVYTSQPIALANIPDLDKAHQNYSCIQNAMGLDGDIVSMNIKQPYRITDSKGHVQQFHYPVRITFAQSLTPTLSSTMMPKPNDDQQSIELTELFMDK